MSQPLTDQVPGAPVDESSTQDNTSQPSTGSGLESLPEWAQKEIKRLRDEAARARVSAKEQAAEEARRQLLEQLSNALGLNNESADTDPKKLTEALAAERARAQEALAEAIEYRVYRIAARLGADPERLLDSRSFVDTIDRLDVNPLDDDEFEDAVSGVVTKYLEKHPEYRAGGGTSRRGFDTSGGSTPSNDLYARIADAERKGDVRESIMLKALLARQRQQ